MKVPCCSCYLHGLSRQISKAADTNIYRHMRQIRLELGCENASIPAFPLHCAGGSSDSDTPGQPVRRAAEPNRLNMCNLAHSLHDKGKSALSPLPVEKSMETLLLLLACSRRVNLQANLLLATPRPGSHQGVFEDYACDSIFVRCSQARLIFSVERSPGGAESQSQSFVARS